MHATSQDGKFALSQPRTPASTHALNHAVTHACTLARKQQERVREEVSRGKTQISTGQIGVVVALTMRSRSDLAKGEGVEQKRLLGEF